MIDYTIRKDCTVRRELGDDKLVQLVKSRDRASGILRQLLGEGKTEAQALEYTFAIHTYRGEGSTTTEHVTVRELFQQSDALKSLAPHCKDCPLNGNSEAFGCYRNINYPISAEAERYLAQLVDAAVQRGLPDSIIVRFIQEEDISGNFFKELRLDPSAAYLEFPTPLEIIVGRKLFRKDKITTDQLLESMFAFEVLERTHQMFLIFLSGGIHISTKPPQPGIYTGEFQVAEVEDEEGNVGFWTFHLPPAPSDDHSITQIKSFFRHVFRAFATDERIEVDY